MTTEKTKNNKLTKKSKNDVNKPDETCEEAVYGEMKKPKSKETEYYKRVFSLIESRGKHIWNWPAFFFGPVWALYRKMYLFNFLGMLIWSALDNLFDRNFLIIFFYMCCWGFFGNTLYYMTVKSKIKRGYHLIEDHKATSFWGAMANGCGLIFMSVVDYFSREKYFSTHELKDNELNTKNIERYLNPRKEHSDIMKVSIAFAFVLEMFLIGKFVTYAFNCAFTDQTLLELALKEAKTYDEIEQKREEIIRKEMKKLLNKYSWPRSGSDYGWIVRTLKAKFETEK